MVPSARPSFRAATSAGERRGGCIFVFVSNWDASTAASVSVRWWVHTSAVTGTPWALARRTSSTPRAVEMCATWRAPPVRAASSMSRAIITSSDAAGMPSSPSRADTSPSCICPLGLSVSSSMWLMMGRSSMLLYSRARRISPAVGTGAPSSLKATAPPASRSAISAISSPARSLETHAMGCTPTGVSAARSRTNSTTSRVWRGGSVLGMQATSVNPPARAARLPVATVSLCS